MSHQDKYLDIPTVHVRVDELVGLTSTDIGDLVLSRVHNARIEAVLSACTFRPPFIDHLPAFGRGEPLTISLILPAFITNLGMSYRGLAPYLPDFSLALSRFRDIEILRTEAPALEDLHRKIVVLLSQAHAYLLRKPNALTVNQMAALEAIYAIRNGCRICHTLDGHHTDRCRQLTRPPSPSI